MQLQWELQVVPWMAGNVWRPRQGAMNWCHPLCQTKGMRMCRAGWLIQTLCGTQIKRESIWTKYPHLPRGTCKGHQKHERNTACEDTKIQWCSVAPEWSEWSVWLLKVSLDSYLQTRNGLDRSEN